MHRKSLRGVLVLCAGAALAGCSSHSSGVLPSGQIAGPRTGAAAPSLVLPSMLTTAYANSLRRVPLTPLPMGVHIAAPILPRSVTATSPGVAHPNSSVGPGDAQVVGTVVFGGGSYHGMYAEHSVWKAEDFPLAYPPGATGPQELFGPLSLGTNGSCLSPATIALNTAVQAYTFFAVFNYCGPGAPTAISTQITDAFMQNFVTINAGGVPTYRTLTFTPDVTPSASSIWYVYLFNFTNASWDLFTQSTGKTTTTYGYTVWESAYQPGPCSGPNPPVEADNLQLLNGSTNALEPIHPTMAQTTSTIIGTAGLSCFNTDATGPRNYKFSVLSANDSWIVQSYQPRIASPGCTFVTGVFGYYPCDLRKAYNLPSTTRGTGQTVAIVDAFDDPNAEGDLALYRSTFGMAACTTANGCFRKVNQTGGTAPPPADAGWAGEISLDLDMVSAICPNCHILLVEANTNGLTDLEAAEDRAAILGANAISNSFSSGEFSTETTDDAHFNHPGIAITVSSGDSDFGVQWPASSQYVTAVGGTSLYPIVSTRGAYETAWGGQGTAGAGSGCSAFEPKPAWQSGLAGCANRVVADVSAVADPHTGVATYDSFQSSGWGVSGGTSASAPIIAAVYALAGNEAALTYGSYPYSHTAGLFDITSGGNGLGCSPLYLCTAGPGYDGPTGLGTPNGLTAFGFVGPNVLRANTALNEPLRDVRSQLRSARAVRLCGAAPAGRARCNALRLVGLP